MIKISSDMVNVLTFLSYHVGQILVAYNGNYSGLENQANRGTIARTRGYYGLMTGYPEDGLFR